MSLRQRLLALVAALGAAVVLAAVVRRGMTEPVDTNTYALLAEAFLKGRFDLSGCYDLECVKSGGKLYLIQPAFPALFAMPLVAWQGVHTHAFIFLAMGLTAVALVFWWRIFERLGLERATSGWILLGLVASTPLAFAMIRSETVWFFAHVCAFLMVTIAIHEALAGRAVTAGLALGCAFLSRQNTLFVLPFLFAISLSAQARILPPSRETVVKGLKMGLAFGVAFGFYVFYNWTRFGQPFEAGHTLLAAQMVGHTDVTPLTIRLRDIGVFSKDFVLFNAFYLFLQGFHAEFTGPALLKLSGLDPFGTSILAASPFLIFLFFTPRDRTIWFGLLAVVPAIALLLFFHSNGYKQYSGNRYLLDFLPVLILFLARAVTAAHRPVFALLVTWGILLNVATIAVLAVTKT